MTPTPCEVPGCDTKPLSFWGRRLCFAHATEAGQALSQRGLDMASWPERCQAVAEWVASQQRSERRAQP
jgi:hypothetical protein